MRKTLPALLGLALVLGSAGVSQAADQNKEKIKVENNGDVKIKGKTHDATGKHRYKTKVRNGGDETTVKTKEK